MNIPNALRADVLTEALPHIQKYSDKILVVKYGGSAMVNDKLRESVMGDIVLLSLIGIKVVLVHGGGSEITETMSLMGKESTFVDGLRVTDSETMDIALMVLAGKINKCLVNYIGTKGGKAVGLCGLDGGMVLAKQLDERLGYVGEIRKVDPKLILDLLDNNYIPVVSSIGYDESGQIYNINADTAAAQIAGSLNAESLILMTDTSGVLLDRNDPDSVVSIIDVKGELPALVEDGTITEGMIPKVKCCSEALSYGVKRVFIIDGRIEHSILIETLTDEGLGTMFVQNNDLGD